MEWSSPPPPPSAGRPREFSQRLREFRRKNSAHSPSPPPSAALMAAWWSALGASLREDELARGGRVAFCLGEPPMMNVLPKTTVR